MSIRKGNTNVFRPIHKPDRVVASRFSATLVTSSLADLATAVSGLEYDTNEDGSVRTLTCSDPHGLCPQSVSIRKVREAVTQNALLRRIFELGDVELRNGKTAKEADGWRVDFKQVMTVEGTERGVYPVRGGFLHVFVNEQGIVYSITSTLRHGKKPGRLGNVISAKKAVAIAKTAHAAPKYGQVKYVLTFSEHEGQLEPVYEVTLCSNNPRRVVMYMIKAASGELVYRDPKLHYAKSKSVPAKVFLRIPNPNQPIDKQVLAAFIEGLPDPKVLANQRFTMYMGSDKSKPVKAKADGTFNYEPSEPEFSAVAIFYAMNKQFEIYERLGMKKQDKPIAVFVDDPNVQDNAYFDPTAYEIHMGVGSGLPNGLNVHIGWDLGVAWHENGHHTAFVQTPGQDFPGQQGGGIHEGTAGDVLGDLAMDFWFRATYSKELGHELTKDEISKDPLIIGVYALPPDGIRKERNDAQAGKDESGEPHNDGLIPGGACAEILVAMATASNVTIIAGIEAFIKMTLKAFSLVPAHKVLFSDLLRAYLTADQQLFKGANKDLITSCFARHGIKSKKVELS